MSQVITGAAKGAAAGSAFGPVGAAIGGLLGAVGGLFGDEAAKYRRKAAKEEQQRIEKQQAVQRRDVVRAFFINRANALAAAAGGESGGMDSSAAMGVNSSIESQGRFNIKFFDEQIVSQIIQRAYLKKAGKKQEVADTIGGFVEGASQIDWKKLGGNKRPPGSGNGRVPDSTLPPSIFQE